MPRTLSSDSWPSQNFSYLCVEHGQQKMMARRFQCERRPSYSALKESMNGRQYSDLFPRQFVTIVTAQLITEKKIVVLFLSSEKGEF
jgi:hypothetical protein